MSQFCHYSLLSQFFLWTSWTDMQRIWHRLGSLSSVQLLSCVWLFVTPWTAWSTPAFPAHCQLPELAQTCVHQVSDAIQSSHPLLSPSPPAFNLSQHQGLFQWVSSSHQVAWYTMELLIDVKKLLTTWLLLPNHLYRYLFKFETRSKIRQRNEYSREDGNGETRQVNRVSKTKFNLFHEHKWNLT